MRHALICLVLPLLASQPLAAEEVAPTRILIPSMLQAAFTDELEPLLRSSIAAPLSIEYVQMAKLVARLNQGETADVVIITRSSIPPLAAKGLVKTQLDVVQSALGLAVADGAPAPVLKTTDDLIAFLKATPSIALFGTGVSGAEILQFAAKHGLTDMLMRKVTIITQGSTATLLRDGKVASAVQQVGQLKFGGAHNIVLLPAALQTQPVSSIVVFSATHHPDVAARIVQLLTSAEAVAAYQRGGLTSVIK